ncbi:MAG: hypothetical protein DWQ04_11575, partial [Chloroflexi bacterium]
MNNSQYRRMLIIIVSLFFVMVIIVGRLFAFQIVQATSWAERAGNEVLVVDRPERGTIYDRNGAILAANTADYQISVAPNLVTNAEEMATTLAPVLEIPRYDILNKLESGNSFEMLSGRVSSDVAGYLFPLHFDGLKINPLPR